MGIISLCILFKYSVSVSLLWQYAKLGIGVLSFYYQVWVEVHFPHLASVDSLVRGRGLVTDGWCGSPDPPPCPPDTAPVRRGRVPNITR